MTSRLQVKLEPGAWCSSVHIKENYVLIVLHEKHWHVLASSGIAS